MRHFCSISVHESNPIYSKPSASGKKKVAASAVDDEDADKDYVPPRKPADDDDDDDIGSIFNEDNEEISTPSDLHTLLVRSPLASLLARNPDCPLGAEESIEARRSGGRGDRCRGCTKEAEAGQGQEGKHQGD